MKEQLELFQSQDDDGVEYDHDFIAQHPIPAFCMQGKSPYCRGKVEGIHAPQLENVRCFWCGGRMKPVYPEAYQQRLATLWQHRAG